MKKTLLLISLLLTLAGELFAQNNGVIVGHVKDAKTQEHLIGVNVSIPGTLRGVSTDTSGNFRIDKLQPGTYRLQFSYIGYEVLLKTDIIVNLSSPATVNVSLVPLTVAGETITVTAGYFTQANLAPVSTTLLSREEIRRFPGGFEDVVRTAATLPGVAVINDGGRNDLLVRGGGPSENLYLINGLEVPNINHFGNQGLSSGTLSFLNLDFVENMEFSTGGFAVKYGDKMSSVLSIDTRPGRNDRLGGKATISATQFGLNLEGPIRNKGSYLFSARRSYLDIIFKALGLPFVPVYTDYNFFAHYDLSPTSQLSLMSLLAVDRVDRDQSTLENRVTNAGIMGNEQDQFISGIKYRRLFSEGFVDFIAGNNNNAYRFRQIDSTEQEYFRSKATENEFTLKVDSYFRLSEANGLSAGLGLKRVGNENTTTFADTIYDRNGRQVPLELLHLPNTIAVDTADYKLSSYLEIERKFANKFEVHLGLRGDYYNFIEEKFHTTARFSAIAHLSTTTKFKTSIGRYEQAPSYVWVLNPVNRQLKPLRNDMLVAGINHLLMEDTNLSFETYFKKYSNLPAGATPELAYLILTNTGVGYGGREDNFQSFGYIPLVSEGEGQAYGFELQLQKKLSETPLYGQISLAYSKSEYTARNGETYPGQYDQRFILNISGGYKFGANWEVSGKFRFYTGSPYTHVYLPEENNGLIQNLPQDYLQSRLDPGHVLDLRIDRRFNFANWTLIAFTDVQNVYNNLLPRKPQYDFWARKISDKAELGILPSIGVSVEF